MRFAYLSPIVALAVSVGFVVRLPVGTLRAPPLGIDDTSSQESLNKQFHRALLDLDNAPILRDSTWESVHDSVHATQKQVGNHLGPWMSPMQLLSLGMWLYDSKVAALGLSLASAWITDRLSAVVSTKIEPLTELGYTIHFQYLAQQMMLANINGTLWQPLVKWTVPLHTGPRKQVFVGRILNTTQHAYDLMGLFPTFVYRDDAVNWLGVPVRNLRRSSDDIERWLIMNNASFFPALEHMYLTGEDMQRYHATLVRKWTWLWFVSHAPSVKQLREDDYLLVSRTSSDPKDWAYSNDMTWTRSTALVRPTRFASID
jgi:hypothetical protein